MRYLWSLGILICILISCRQDQKTDGIEGDTGVEFNAGELPKRVRMNAKSTAITKEWQEFVDFDSSFDAIYAASNNEDLILVIDELLVKLKVMEKSTYPESFDKAQIRSRQNVMKTYILKAKAALMDRADFVEPINEMIEAYNALRLQFDVMMNSQLDPKLLTDDS